MCDPSGHSFADMDTPDTPSPGEGPDTKTSISRNRGTIILIQRRTEFTPCTPY